jgi:hypothetical protein
MGTTSRNARLQLLFAVLAAFVLEAHARPDFDRAGAGSELRRRRPPHSPQEPLRFKQSLRVLSTNGDVLHLSYDVTRLNSTRVLDEMDSIDDVRCSPDYSLTIILAPGYMPEDVASEFLLDAVVNGGSEWNCSWVTGEDPAPFSRRILGVAIIGTDIVMNTSGCSPFESFAKEDIELWAVLGQPSNDTGEFGFPSTSGPDDDHGPGVDTRESSESTNDDAAGYGYGDDDVNIRRSAEVQLEEHEREKHSTRQAQICCSSFTVTSCGSSCSDEELNCENRAWCTWTSGGYYGGTCAPKTSYKDCGPNSCQYANDGMCDEPRFCLVGTDSTDCQTVSSPPPPPPQSSSCNTFTGCCQDHSRSACGGFCAFYESCCENIAGCTWTAGYSGGTCSGRPTSNPSPCCGGTCYYTEPATDLLTTASRSYDYTMLNMNFRLQNDCSYRYYYKFKGSKQDGYVWSETVTETYEHWIQQMCTATFNVNIRAATSSASLPPCPSGGPCIPVVDILGRSITLGGVTMRLSVALEVSLGLSASLTYTGADMIYARAGAQQTVKMGCRDQCRPFTSDIIFEQSFQQSTSDNFNTVTGLSGSLEPSVTLTLSAGIIAENMGWLGDWGFKISGRVKMSVPLTARMGSYLPAVSNPERFFIGGALDACKTNHLLDLQMRMKVDLLSVDAIVAIYWSVQKQLISQQNLMTYDLLIYCGGPECAPGMTLSGGNCVSCAAGTYKSSAGSEACTFCPIGKYSTTTGASSLSMCLNCGVNTYSTVVGALASSTCIACPSNSQSVSGSTASSSCVCNLGFTGPSGGTCSACAAGKYKIVTGNAGCTDCNAGKYSATIGANSDVICLFCPAGTYSAAGASACSEATTTPTPPLPTTSTAAGPITSPTGTSSTTPARTTPSTLPPDIEGSLIEAAQKYPGCQCTLSWQEIRRSNPRTRTGGLGEFFVEGKYEVWVCLQDNVCSTLDDWFCYVFNEQTLTFKAWGLNAEVKVVKNALK